MKLTMAKALKWPLGIDQLGFNCYHCGTSHARFDHFIACVESHKEKI